MCIRDRNRLEQTTLRLTARAVLRSGAWVTSQVIRWVAPVSYTHLGGVQRTAEGAVVFNRKFYCTGLICYLVEVQHSVLLNGQGGDIVCKPVSYTHLDVYKRQR